MATKRKGILVTASGSGDWSKHLRHWGKRIFWKRERCAVRKHLRSKGWVNEMQGMGSIMDAPDFRGERHA